MYPRANDPEAIAQRRWALHCRANRRRSVADLALENQKSQLA
jgi:hypothetical protein